MELNYKKLGEEGPAILILHGLLGSMDNWQTIAKQLSENSQVYIIDQRNHGRSPHSEEMDYTLLSGDIAWFCTQHAIRKASVIGHSMGGKAAMVLALSHPELVEQLVVVDIAPVPYDGGHEVIMQAMADAPLATAAKREEIDDFLKQRIPEFSVRQFILKNLSRNDDGKFEWKCNLPSLIRNYPLLMDFPVIESVFNGPAAFIRGDRSGYISDENWPDCRKYFPSAELITIADAGHWVHAEAPGIFVDALQKVLKKSPGNRG